ncbi:uncharacterized protein PFLUO_LOCUS5798 [Penicillium psychrofluorescens]|uniref:uncharacterized protein n=1 Tax=Penicillium psychrofluorescens TaxID=3158075 RepID=UPI003CCDA502
MAYQEEHSKASKQVKDVPVQALQVAYKFPRAVVDLNVFCLQLTSQCIADAKAATTVDMVDQFYRDYGNAFVTRFTLGGELYSSRILTAEEQSSIIKTKEKVKAAASFSFSSPWTCGSASVTKVESNESTAGEQELHHNLQLAWEARGGDTLLCTNPPQWANTVKDYRLWRIMDQQQVVNMVSFIKEIDVGVGDHLESPKTGGGDDENKILDVIRQVLETKKTDVLASNIKKFYKSDNFEIEEYNKLLGEDEVAMKTKKAWRNLNIEEKRNVGWLAYQKNVISIH